MRSSGGDIEDVAALTKAGSLAHRTAGRALELRFVRRADMSTEPTLRSTYECAEKGTLQPMGGEMLGCAQDIPTRLQKSRLQNFGGRMSGYDCGPLRANALRRRFQ